MKKFHVYSSDGSRKIGVTTPWNLGSVMVLSAGKIIKKRSLFEIILKADFRGLKKNSFT